MNEQNNENAVLDQDSIDALMAKLHEAGAGEAAPSEGEVFILPNDEAEVEAVTVH